MKTHFLKIIPCFLLIVFMLPLACQAQKKANSKLAKQIIGTWIVQDYVIKVREEHKNNPEAIEYIKKVNLTMNNMQTAFVKNRIAFTFKKGGKLQAKSVQGSVKDINANWRLEGNILHITSDDKSFEQEMKKLHASIENNQLNLGILEDRMNATPLHMITFVCKKGNISELITTPLFYDKENAPNPQLVTNETITMTVGAEKINENGDTYLHVKYDNDGEWEKFLATIEDFDHENGYEYVLNVEKITTEVSEANNPDKIITTLITYRLKEIISKTKK